MNNSSSKDTGNSNNSNNSQLLESKLHTVAASFRQKRDEAHRIHQLASERLRLAQEECAAVEASVKAAKENLQAIQEKAGGSAEAVKQRDALNAEVSHLQKEVHFQHSELIHKRTKFKELRASTEQAEAQRKESLSKFRIFVQDRRVKDASLPSSPSSVMEILGDGTATVPVAAMVDECGMDMDQCLEGRWPKIIRKQAEQLRISVSNLRELERIAAGYKKLLANGSMNETATGVPSTQ